MDKNQIIKYVLIAGAVYLVYRYLQTSGALGGGKKAAEELPAPGTSEPDSLPPAGVAPPRTTVDTVPLVSISPDLRSKMEALLATDNTGGVAPDGVRTHNFYVYQYHYQQLTGHDLPPSESAFGLDEAGRLQLMTFDQFWDLLVAAHDAGKTVGYPSLGQLQRLASAWTM